MQIFVKSGRHSPRCVEGGYPSQRAQSRHEAIFAATDVNEAWQSFQAPPNRSSRDGEDTFALVVADERILLRSVADKVAVGHPLRLNKLELPMQMRTDQQEHPAAFSAVILEHALRQGWSIVRTAAQEVVEIHSDNVVLQGIARIHSTN